MKTPLLLLLIAFCLWLFSALPLHAENWYRVSFCSKGTGPREVIVEALNDAGAGEQVKARFPGAYNISFIQIRKPEIIVE